MEKDGFFCRFHASILLLTQFIGFEISCRTVQGRPVSPQFWTPQPANIVLFAWWLLSFNSIRFNCYTSFAIHYHASSPFSFLWSQIFKSTKSLTQKRYILLTRQGNGIAHLGTFILKCNLSNVSMYLYAVERNHRGCLTSIVPMTVNIWKPYMWTAV